MKSLIKRLYTAITAPLYRRLLRDLTIQIQDAHSTTLDYHEKITARLLDELVCVRLEMAKSVEQVTQPRVLPIDNRPVPLTSASSVSQQISDDEIHKIVNEISSHMKIVELACDTQIPMSEILDWRSKYTGLTVNAVRKMRRIEQENERLKQELARLQLEAAVSAGANILG